jgi:hypothetical protein
VLLRLVPSGRDGADDALNGLFVGAQARREATFVTDGGGEAFLLEDALQRVEHLGAGAERLRERGKAVRHDHELLDFESVVRVGTAVDDVHQGRRQHASLRAAEVAPERKAHDVRARARHGHRDGQDRVRAELRLVRGAVELDQPLVDAGLIQRAHAQDGRAELVVHVGNGLEHALAQIALLVVVAQLASLVYAGGSTARNGGAAGAARGLNFRLDRGVTPGV